MKNNILRDSGECLEKVKVLCTDKRLSTLDIEEAVQYLLGAQAILADINIPSDKSVEQLEAEEKLREHCYEIIFTVAKCVLLPADRFVITVKNYQRIEEQLNKLAMYQSYQQQYREGLSLIINVLSQQIEEYFIEIRNQLSKTSFVLNTLFPNKRKQFEQLQKDFYSARTEDKRNQIINDLIKNYAGYINGSHNFERKMKDYNHYTQLYNKSLSEHQNRLEASLKNVAIDTNHLNRHVAENSILTIPHAIHTENNVIEQVIQTTNKASSLKRKAEPTQLAEMPAKVLASSTNNKVIEKTALLQAQGKPLVIGTDLSWKKHPIHQRIKDLGNNIAGHPVLSNLPSNKR